MIIAVANIPIPAASVPNGHPFDAAAMNAGDVSCGKLRLGQSFIHDFLDAAGLCEGHGHPCAAEYPKLVVLREQCFAS